LIHVIIFIYFRILLYIVTFTQDVCGTECADLPLENYPLIHSPSCSSIKQVMYIFKTEFHTRQHM